MQNLNKGPSGSMLSNPTVPGLPVKVATSLHYCPIKTLPAKLGGACSPLVDEWKL